MRILLCGFCPMYEFHRTWPSHCDHTIHDHCIVVVTLVAVVMLLVVVTLVAVAALVAVVMLVAGVTFVAVVTLVGVVTLVTVVMLVECRCANDLKQMASCGLHREIVSCGWSHANVLCRFEHVNFIVGIGTWDCIEIDIFRTMLEDFCRIASRRIESRWCWIWSLLAIIAWLLSVLLLLSTKLLSIRFLPCTNLLSTSFLLVHLCLPDLPCVHRLCGPCPLSCVPSFLLATWLRTVYIH